VAKPTPTAGLEKETELVNSVLDELTAKPNSGFHIALVEPGKSADLRLAVLRENAIAALTLAAFAVVLFVMALGLPIPVWPW